MQLGTWIQHKVSLGQGYSIRSVGTGYTNDMRPILVARKSSSKCKHCDSTRFDHNTSDTIESEGQQMLQRGSRAG